MKAKEGSALGFTTSMAADQHCIRLCERFSDSFSQIMEVRFNYGGDYSVPVVVQPGSSYTWRWVVMDLFVGVVIPMLNRIGVA